jgi:hypothetical protein
MFHWQKQLVRWRFLLQIRQTVKVGSFLNKPKGNLCQQVLTVKPSAIWNASIGFEMHKNHLRPNAPSNSGQQGR